MANLAHLRAALEQAETLFEAFDAADTGDLIVPGEHGPRRCMNCSAYLTRKGKTWVTNRADASCPASTKGHKLYTQAKDRPLKWDDLYAALEHLVETRTAALARLEAARAAKA